MASADPFSRVSAGCLRKQLASSGKSAGFEEGKKERKKWSPISEKSTRICRAIACWRSHSGLLIPLQFFTAML